MGGIRDLRERRAIERLALRLRCWWRGRHDYRIVGMEEVDGELVGRLACQDCGSEPGPEKPG